MVFSTSFDPSGDCVFFTKGKGTEACFLLFTTVLLVVEKTKKGKMHFKLRFPLSELMILAKDAEERKSSDLVCCPNNPTRLPLP